MIVIVLILQRAMQHIFIALLLVALPDVCDGIPGNKYSEKLPFGKTTGEFSAVRVLCIIIQHNVALPKFGHGAINIRRRYTTDILRYTELACMCWGEKWRSAFFF